MKIMYKVFIILSVVLVVIKSAIIQSNECNECSTKICVKEAARILNSIDESVSPCNDFYQFVCGNWIEKTSIPDHKSSYSLFGESQEQLEKQLKGLLKKPLSDTENRDFVIKAKNFFDSCMNTTLIDSYGNKPLVSLLKELNEWPLTLQMSPNLVWEEIEWSELYIRLRKLGLGNTYLFSLSVSTDLKNNSKNIISLDQPSFGLGSRDLVMKGPNDTSVNAYRDLFIKSALKLGANKHFLNQTVDEVLKFETTLANISTVKEERRNITQIYNRLSIDELNKITPNIDWLKIIQNFVSVDIRVDDEIVVYDMPYIKALSTLLKKTKNKLLANYIVWRVVLTKIYSLSSDWIDIYNEFQAVVYGTKKATPRDDLCLSVVSGSLDKAVANLYVSNFFHKEDKQQALEMVENIKNEFKNTLMNNNWMKGETLEHALKKLKNMKTLVGYQEELIDNKKISQFYEKLEISQTEYFENKQRFNKWGTDVDFERLNELNDVYDWRDITSVAAVNAYYYPDKNMVVIPAGILQGVFYDKDRPEYLNYGGIGYIAGHEVTHGFDDSGRQYDASGNLRNWWDSNTDTQYKDKAQCIIDQYSNFTVEEVKLQVNGINTQGENIADNGGLKLAFNAYRNLSKTGSDPRLVGLDYSAEQLFFISSALEFCGKQNDEYLKRQVMTDPHSPRKQRVNGVVSNFNEFSKAFDCPIGSPMNPINKCSVW